MAFTERIKKVWPALVSLGGASVMLLAFFIPSIEEQWDRYQARQVIEQYEKLGNEFFDEERYEMAEEAYSTAFELSEGKRLDIEVKRLDAKINRVNDNPAWGGKLPDSLKEIDFQYLLHFQQDKKGEKTRILNCYGVFLCSLDRLKEAEAAFNEAIHLDPSNDLAMVNLATLYWHQDKFEEAKQKYLQALILAPDNGRGHYNLGQLLLDLNRPAEAKTEFVRALALDPADVDTQKVIDSLNLTSAPSAKD